VNNNRPFTPGWKENKFPRAVCGACRKGLQVGAFYYHEAPARALCKWCAENNPRIPPMTGHQPAAEPPQPQPQPAAEPPQPPATMALVLLELREQTSLLRTLVELMEVAAGRGDAQ